MTHKDTFKANIIEAANLSPVDLLGQPGHLSLDTPMDNPTLKTSVTKVRDGFQISADNGSSDGSSPISVNFLQLLSLQDQLFAMVQLERAHGETDTRSADRVKGHPNVINVTNQ